MGDYIIYSEYIAENVNKAIKYSDYLAENLDKSISFTEYLTSTLNADEEEFIRRKKEERNSKIDKLLND